MGLLALQPVEDTLPNAAAWAIMLGTSLLLIGCAVLVIGIARRTADGRLGTNGWAGIRTKTTMSSDEAWLKAHQAAERDTVLGGWFLGALGPLAIVIASLVGDDPASVIAIWGTIVTIGAFVMLIPIIVGAKKAQTAAKQVMISQR